MSIKDFLREYRIENKATSIKKIRQIYFSLFLNKVGSYLRDGVFEIDIRIVRLHLTKQHIALPTLTKDILNRLEVLQSKHFVITFKKDM